jgi:3-methylcrotonyl-CoA carboxylase beta subunit
MVYAMATARVPRLTVIVGGSYGAGNYGMCGRGFRPDFLFAWPTAKVATMSADVASNVLQELRQNNLRLPSVTQAELHEIDSRTRAQYSEQSDPYYATSRLWDDGLIAPEQTRDVLGLCLSLVLSRPEPRGYKPVFRM